MKITILTMFPQLFDGFLQSPVVQRAIRRESLELAITDIKEFAPGSFRHIDDSPFGGGAGMVMRCQPVLDALRYVKGEGEGAPASVTVALSPAGTVFSQKTARRYKDLDHLILICGHYEGMDERIYRHADEELSIGDYILTGGEIAAMAVADAVIRLLPGALRDKSTGRRSRSRTGCSSIRSIRSRPYTRERLYRRCCCRATTRRSESGGSRSRCAARWSGGRTCLRAGT